MQTEKPKENGNAPKENEKVPEESAGKTVSKSGVSILTLKVTNGKTESAPLPLPAANEALSKLLDGISEGTLKRGDLHTFADRELASLKGDYGTLTGSGDFKVPSDLDEKDWDKILSNNRALHGYYYDFDQNILIKASKKGMAFYPLHRSMYCLR